jgi:probable HAF family extracellular repeat protein
VPNNGFTLTLTGHHLLPNFTSENFPNATQTQVISINNLSKTGGFYVDAQGQTHGFIRDNNGVYQKIDAPKTAFNQILGVNDLGESAGYSSTDPTGATIQKAFIHNSAGFVYVPLKAPSIGNSQATGINDANIVSGFYVDANGNNFGFLWDTNNKTIKSLQYPKANFTQALGINNAGQVVGVYSMDNGATTHGFVYKQGQYTRVDEPNSANLSATLINGINDRGEIVGFYTDKAGDTVGFIGTPKTPLW